MNPLGWRQIHTAAPDLRKGGQRRNYKSSLVLEYRFDDIQLSQVATDTSGRGFWGRFGSTTTADTNDPTRTIKGVSLTTDDYIIPPRTPTELLVTDKEYTIIAVCTFSDVSSTYNAIVAKNDGVGNNKNGVVLYKDPTVGKVKLSQNDSDAGKTFRTTTAADTVSANTPTFIAAVYNKTDIRLYTSTTGALSASAPQTTGFTPEPSGYPLCIGRLPYTAAYYHEGDIYYIAIYNATLSKEEIQGEYYLLSNYLKPRGAVLPLM